MIEGLDKRLQNSRINAGLSRAQIARLLDVSDSLIGLYETGVRQPSLSTLIKLSSIYKVSTDYYWVVRIQEIQVSQPRG